MSNLVIVAIPDENDRVWKVSSEKVPHLTLLYLGDADQVQNLDKIVQFVEHAATMTLRRFYLPVDRRGELGDDPVLGPADVLFFKKGRYDYKAIRDFRVALLQDNNIRTAHDSAEQIEGVWLPHLTLGYDKQPAKPDPTDRDYGFYDVAFTKIAVWPDNYEGPEFLLKDYWDEWEALETVPMDVAMSSIRPEDAMAQSAELGADFLLEHFGVKGMHWGQRKAPPEAVAATAESRVPHGAKAKTKIEVEGGENHPAHADAIKVAQSQAKLKKSGAAALSNNELRDVATRIQLEEQVKTLTTKKGRKFLTRQLENQGQQQIQKGVNTAVSKAAKRGAATAALLL